MQTPTENARALACALFLTIALLTLGASSTVLAQGETVTGRTTTPRQSPLPGGMAPVAGPFVSTAIDAPFATPPILPGPPNVDFGAATDWCPVGTMIAWPWTDDVYSHYCNRASSFNFSYHWRAGSNSGDRSYVGPRLLAFQQHPRLCNFDNNTCFARFWKAKTQVVGHRAERNSAPENTLVALAFAMQKQVAAEMDFMIDCEENIFVLHDAIYDFYQHGRSWWCHRASMPDALEAFRGTCSVDAGKANYSVPIPSLQDVLDRMKGYVASVSSGMPSLYLELKIPTAPWVFRNDAALGQKVATEVEQNHLQDRIWLTSLSMTALESAYANSTSVKRVLVNGPPNGVNTHTDLVNLILAARAQHFAAVLFDVRVLYERDNSIYKTALGNHSAWVAGVDWSRFTGMRAGVTYTAPPPAGVLPERDVFLYSSMVAFFGSGGSSLPEPAPAAESVYGVCGRDMVLPCLYGGPTYPNAPERTAFSSNSLGRVFVSTHPTATTQFVPYGETSSMPRAPLMLELSDYAELAGIKLGGYWSDASLSTHKRPMTANEIILAVNMDLRDVPSFDRDLQGNRYIGHAVNFNLDFYLVDDLAATQTQWSWMQTHEIKAAQLESDVWQ